jgi:CRISPR-associated protein Cpf1
MIVDNTKIMSHPPVNTNADGSVKASGVFDEFTNLYSLSKTLKFELRPVGNTAQMLIDNKIFETDEKRKRQYVTIKPYFDKLHREFFNRTTNSLTLVDLEEYKTALNNWQKNKKNKILKDDLVKKEKTLRESITKRFTEGCEIGGLEVKNKILFEAGIFNVLKLIYGEDQQTLYKDENNEEKSIFDDWNGFVGYFNKFHETRKNLYKDDGTSTAFATRIIDQNLRRFCDNLDLLKTANNKQIDFSEVEIDFGFKIDEYFVLDTYNSCVQQAGIVRYNQIIGGQTLADGTKLKGINEIIGKFRQDNAGDKTNYLKKLDKQILSDDNKDDFIISISDDAELKEVLQSFYENSNKRALILKDLFKDFTVNNSNYDLSKIFLSKEAFETISRTWLGSSESFQESVYFIISKRENKAWYESLRGDKDPKISRDKEKLRFPSFISLEHIKNTFESLENTDQIWKNRFYENEENANGFLEDSTPENIWQQFLDIFSSKF